MGRRTDQIGGWAFIHDQRLQPSPHRWLAHVVGALAKGALLQAPELRSTLDELQLERVTCSSNWKGGVCENCMLPPAWSRNIPANRRAQVQHFFVGAVAQGCLTAASAESSRACREKVRAA